MSLRQKILSHLREVEIKRVERRLEREVAILGRFLGERGKLADGRLVFDEADAELCTAFRQYDYLKKEIEFLRERKKIFCGEA